ncbi:MAG: hypothetical protein M3373_01610 [Gemmatimonadota bacterium]|nr:hypothetical protein [Gemmatimonadota bacterium]
MRNLVLAATLIVAASFGAPALAAQGDPDVRAAGGGKLPEGWHARLDRPNARMEELKFEKMGPGLHATSGPAAIYWNPAHTGTGAYTAQVTFTQTKAPTHPEAYGLFIGGRDLAAPTQDYLYFLVRGDGKYFVAHRAGADRHIITPWTDHAAIKKQDEAGKATNTLAFDVTAESVRLLANGTEVMALPRSNPMVRTDGQVGLRVNHNLDVHIAGFEVKPK